MAPVSPPDDTVFFSRRLADSFRPAIQHSLANRSPSRIRDNSARLRPAIPQKRAISIRDSQITALVGVLIPEKLRCFGSQCRKISAWLPSQTSTPLTSTFRRASVPTANSREGAEPSDYPPGARHDINDMPFTTLLSAQIAEW